MPTIPPIFPPIFSPILPVLQLLRLWVDFINLQLKDQPLDPYAIWGLLTRFRVLGHDGKMPSVVTFSVELNAPFDPTVHTFPLSAQVRVAKRPGWASQWPTWVPSVYHNPLPGTGKSPTFITLRLDTHEADWEQVSKDVWDLILLSYVKRLQIGLPRGARNPDREEGATPAVLPGWAAEHDVLVGAIDNACPFAHRALRCEQEPMVTRVVSLWDQTSMPLSPVVPSAPCGFPYGVHWSHKQLNDYLTDHAQGQEVDEGAVYSSGLTGSRPLARRASHAAAVMSLLAGGGRAAPRMPQPLDAGGTTTQFHEPSGDAAARAPLAVVQLPAEQTSVRAGRWLAVNALDGLHHLMAVARRLGDQAGSPSPALVVNMSYGAMAGPHDGTGMLEAAIDELCRESNDRLAVVLSAGNSQGTLLDGEKPLDFEVGGPHAGQAQKCYVPGGMHARQALEPGGSATFTLFIPPDKQFETYVEFWFSVQGEKGDVDQFLAPSTPGGGPGEVGIVLEPPVGAPWPPLHCKEVRVAPAPDDDKEAEAGLFFMRKPTQGLHRSMALLVVAATQVAHRHVEAPSGRWRITMRHKQAAGDAGARRFFVDAWVERDDTEVGAVRTQSARFVPNVDGSSCGVTDQNTFSSIATGHETFRAGAVMDRGNGLATEWVSAYSAAAIDDDSGPEFSAIADTHAALPGIRVSGSQSGMVVRANGTSMAAPQAARYLVNKLAGGSTPERERVELAKICRGDARLGKKTV